MPEVTGTITDPQRDKWYILKAAGSPATEIFAFYARREYNATDILQLTLLPTQTGSSGTGSSDDAHVGVYITANVTLQDVLCENGNLSCPRTGKTFAKQATLEPHDNNVMVVTNFLRNGEILMQPEVDDHPPSEKFTYLFSPILIGKIDHLDTSMGLAMLKTRLSKLIQQKVDAITQADPNVAGPSGTRPRMTFSPATSSEDSANTGSLESSASIASSILAGTLDPTPENRSSSLSRIMTSGLDADFQPWMTSTEIPSANQRPTSSQSLPTPDGSPSSGDSPQRPHSTTPIKGRKKHKKVADKSYRPDPRGQPTIREFLTPSPPKTPTPRESPTMMANKRRSLRLNPGDQPSSKRQNLDNSGNRTSHTEASMDLTGPTQSNGSSTSQSVSVDLFTESEELLQSSSIAPETSVSSASTEEIILEEPITLEEPAPNSSVEYLGETGIPMRNQREPLAVIDLLDDTPNSSQESGRILITSPGQNNTAKNGSNGNHPGNGSPHPSETDPDVIQSSVTLHTNLPLKRSPHHVFIRIIENRLSVKLLTFRAQNLDDLVRCFFAENRDDVDNPEEIQGLAEFEFARLLTPDDSNDNTPVNISTVSDEYESTTVHTVHRDENPPSIVLVSDPEDSIAPEEMGTPQTMSAQMREMEVIRDHANLSFEYPSLIIQDVRTAGEDTLGTSAETAIASTSAAPEDEDNCEEKEEDGDEGEENPEEGERTTRG